MPYFQLSFGRGKEIIDVCNENARQKRLLEPSDLHDLEEYLQCRNVMKLFDEQQAQTPPSSSSSSEQDGSDGSSSKVSEAILKGPLFTAIFRLIQKPLTVAIVWGFLRVCAIFLQVYALAEILDIVGSDSPKDHHLGIEILFVALLGLGALIQSIMQHNVFSLNFESACRCRALLCGLTFRKTLTQAPLFASKASQGKQMNLISSDANVVIEWLVMFVYLWSPLFEQVAAVAWIATEIGYASIATAVAVIVLLPIQIFVGKKVGAYRTESFRIADDRLRALSEYFNGIGVVKMNGWEPSVFSVISALRGRESEALTKGTIVKLLNLTFYFLVPGLLSLATFGILNIYNTDMQPRSTFIVLALLNVIARGFAFVPRGVATFASAISSVNRIEEFLRLDFEEGLPPKTSAGESDQTPVVDTLPVVHITGDYGWEGFTLRNVELKAEKGTITVVVGPVGAGKTTLLNAIMRCCADKNKSKALPLSPLPATDSDDAAKKDSSIFQINSKKYAYVPQEPWIADGTIRDNILFGSEMDMQRYIEVIEACALVKDLEQWGGDLVEVGEKGITLSGGQRQRLSMARACYSDADLILLDDPISAVDAHVAKHLLERCITGYLKGKTIIQVSHHPKPLEFADTILAINSHGEQVFSGPLSELPENYIPVMATTGNTPLGSAGRQTPGRQAISPAPAVVAKEPLVEKEEEERKEEWSETLLGKGRKITVRESGEVGAVSAAIYGRYFVSGGIGTLVFFWIFFVIAQASRNAGEWWFVAWTEREYPELSNTQYILIEAGFVGGTVLFGIVRCVIFAIFTMRASSSFHNKMFTSVLSSPMHFFETVPLGRIMNRFAKDVDYCDDGVPRALFDFLQLIGTVIGSLCLLIYIFPWFSIAFVICVLIFVWLVRLYMPCARQVKRLEGMSRSPSHQLFQQALNGLTTLRSYGREGELLDKFYDTIDITTKTILIADTTQRWIGVRMDWGTVLWVVGIGALCIIFQNDITRSLAGLALGLSLTMTGALQFSVRSAALAESLMTSVERMDEYAQLPAEKDVDLSKEPVVIYDDDGEGEENGDPQSETEAITSDPQKEEKDAKTTNEPFESPEKEETKCEKKRKVKVKIEQTPDLSQWPKMGELEVKNLYAAYPSAPDRRVIKDLSFTAFSGEKIALVGRTGAGKSTILTCFFRLIPNLPVGAITLSGELMSTIDNHTLRSRLGVIPQSSTLFTGTLRSNVDPFNQYTDEEVEVALKKVQLHDMLEDRGLYSEVSEGSSLSVGQKQLVCAARALIKKPKILLMDEATANVDGDTDQRIQTMIRDECKHITVITIAHRLHTVLHYDKVLVLDKGLLAESGHPLELARKEGGIFASMLEAMELEEQETA